MTARQWPDNKLAEQDLQRIQREGPTWDEITQRQETATVNIEDGRLAEGTSQHTWVSALPPAVHGLVLLAYT